MSVDDSVLRIIAEQARLVRAAERAIALSPGELTDERLDEYALVEEAAVRRIAAAFDGEVEEVTSGFDPYHVLNISATAAECTAVRLVAQAALICVRPYLIAAATIDEEQGDE